MRAIYTVPEPGTASPHTDRADRTHTPHPTPIPFLTPPRFFHDEKKRRRAKKGKGDGAWGQVGRRACLKVP